MKRMTNTTTIEGKIYSIGVEEKVSGPASKNPGTPYIGGTLDVATDDAGVNVVQVHYSYVTATTKDGKPNRTYGELKRIIDNGKSIERDGADAATTVRLAPSIDLNDFYPDGGDGDLVSQVRNEGGFVTILSGPGSLKEEKERNKFDVDILINKVEHIDADPEHGTAEYAAIRGAIFRFNNEILPITLRAYNAEAMAYFEGLELPTFTEVKGRICAKHVKTEKVEESAFGEASVSIVDRIVKEYEVTWAKTEPYAFGEEGVLTADEVKEALSNREVKLANEKKRAQDYKKNNSGGAISANANAAAAATTVKKNDTFNF